MNQRRKSLIILINVLVLTFLVLVGSIGYCELSSGSGSTLIIPDDSLVMQGKLSYLSITPENDQIKVDGQVYLNMYPVINETEVLTEAQVQVEVPTLNYSGQFNENSHGIYGTALNETLMIKLNDTLAQTDSWQVKPLEYSYSLNGKSVSNTLNVNPITISSLSNDINSAANIALVGQNVVDYIYSADVTASVYGTKQYNNTFSASIKAQLLDLNGNPLSNQQVSATVYLPGHNYSETISLTTDSNGIVTYSRSEPAIITVSGGKVLTLAQPLTIEGTSFVAAQFWWSQDTTPDPSPPTDEEQANNGPTADPNATVADDPINVTTGNVFSVFSDMVIPGKGLPIEFSRTYNSKTEYQGPLGFGWTHSYNVYLNEDSNSIRLFDGSGALIIFTRNADGTYKSPAGNHSTLTKNSDGTYTLKDKHGAILSFNSSGQVVSIEDRNGNRVTLSYNGSNLTTITNSSGRKITLAYDAKGRIISLTDSMGRTFAYSYDADNNLISHTDQFGNITKYQYKNFTHQHQLLTVTDPKGQQRHFSYDAEGRGVEFYYDGNEHRITIQYDPENNKATTTDSRGNSTTYYFTNVGNTRVITKIVDSAGHSKISEWDADLNKTRYIDENNHSTIITYDTKGNPLSIQDAKGAITKFTYEPIFNMCTSVTDPLGNKTVYDYDAKGNLIKVTDAQANFSTFAYDSSGSMIQSTNPKGNTTNYEYDPAGNLAAVVDPMLSGTTFAYDGIGNCITITDAKGNITKFEYDAKNRPIRIIYPDNTSVGYSYDNTDKLQSLTDPRGNSTI